MRDVNSNIDRFQEYGIYVPTRTLFLNGEVDEFLADTAIKGLHILDSLGDSPITVLLNTVGGDEYHGMAIYDAIVACSSHVIIKGVGHVMSMGSMIIQAGDTRLMAPNAKFMLHYGEWGIEDHPKIARAWMKEEEKFSRMMEDLYLEKIRENHPRFTRRKLQKMLDFDTILSAEETVEMGLIDAVD